MAVVHRTVFRFEYADPERAQLVQRSLKPELDDIDGERTTATLSRDGAVLTLTVEARDLVALRAGCNTWATLTNVAEAVSI